MTKQIFLIDFAISFFHFSSIFFVIKLRKYLIMTNIINLNILKKFYNLINAINKIAQNISTKFSFSRYNVDFVFTISIFLHKIFNTQFTINLLFDFFLNSIISLNLEFHTFCNTFFNSFQNFISIFNNFLINFIV